MKTKLHTLSLLVFFLITSTNLVAQAPVLGAASTFGFFTAIGAFTNIGNSNVAGDIGTNVGAFTGFPPGFLTGQIHVSDAVSIQAALDVNAAYAYLSGLTCTSVLGTTLGNNQELIPGNYCIGSAATLNSNLILNGQGNTNSLFLIKIDGALSTNVLSTVQLINGASSSNIYWQVNGQVSLGDHSVFKGTILANGAIVLLEDATLEGRGLSKAGAISLHNNGTYLGASMLNLKLYIQSYYKNAGMMEPVLFNQNVAGSDLSQTDTITVELRNPLPPYELRSTTNTIVNTHGISSCAFPISGTFYIAIKHRNALQTWSKNPIAIFGNDVNYDFTDSASKAYGDNLILVQPAIFALYSGDINQDENIDLFDQVLLDADISNFEYGYYATDLNGDGNVDLLDFSNLELNINNFIYVQKPL